MVYYEQTKDIHYKINHGVLRARGLSSVERYPCLDSSLPLGSTPREVGPMRSARVKVFALGCVD